MVFKRIRRFRIRGEFAESVPLLGSMVGGVVTTFAVSPFGPPGLALGGLTAGAVGGLAAGVALTKGIPVRRIFRRRVRRR